MRRAATETSAPNVALSFTVLRQRDGEPGYNGTLNITFNDDAPTIDVTKTAGEASILLTTQDAETDGVPTAQDTASSAANFSGVFGLSFAAGADGAATPTLSYALSTVGGASGLFSHGAAINLYLIAGEVVGSTAANIGDVNAGNTVFDIGVDGGGVVTLTQYSQIDHPLQAAPNAAPFDDQFVSLGNGLVTLTASSTITDGDGDTATDSEAIDLGGNIRFADDGPIASVNTQVARDTLVLDESSRSAARPTATAIRQDWRRLPPTSPTTSMRAPSAPTAPGRPAIR